MSSVNLSSFSSALAVCVEAQCLWIWPRRGRGIRDEEWQRAAGTPGRTDADTMTSSSVVSTNAFLLSLGAADVATPVTSFSRAQADVVGRSSKPPITRSYRRSSDTRTETDTC
jgi:hypothetical protein